MRKYSENYLNVSTKTYPPHSDYRKYMRGFYMLKEQYKKELIKEVGDSGYILFDFYYQKGSYNYFKPTDNEYIGNALGWTAAKVKRIRKTLKDANYLLVLGDTGKDGTKYYRVLLGKEVVEHYLKTKTIPVDDLFKQHEVQEVEPNS